MQSLDQQVNLCDLACDEGLLTLPAAARPLEDLLLLHVHSFQNTYYLG